MCVCVGGGGGGRGILNRLVTDIQENDKYTDFPLTDISFKAAYSVTMNIFPKKIFSI